MSSALSSILQGTIAGFTAIYLRDRVQETELKTADTWKYVALQVNHLFLLTGGAIRLASIPLGMFGFLTKTIYILTPFVLIAGLLGKKPTSFEADCINQFGKVYLVGVAVNTLANLILGNPLFAIAILSTFAIDILTKEKGSTLLEQIKKVAAVLAMIGYGAQVFTAHGFMATLAKISTVIMAIKLFVLDLLPAHSQESSLTITPAEKNDPSSSKDSHYPKVEPPSPGLSDSIPKLSELPIDCFLNQPPAQPDGPLVLRPVSQPVAPPHKVKDEPLAESPFVHRESPAVSTNLLKVPVLICPTVPVVLPPIVRVEQPEVRYILPPPVQLNVPTYTLPINNTPPPPPVEQHSASLDILGNLNQPSVDWNS